MTARVNRNVLPLRVIEPHEGSGDPRRGQIADGAPERLRISARGKATWRRFLQRGGQLPVVSQFECNRR
jgi:hypothetical protein